MQLVFVIHTPDTYNMWWYIDMDTISLTDEQLKFARELAMKRSGSMGHSATKNSGNFFNDKPPWYRHYVGAVGEVAFGALYGMDVDSETIGRGDSGVDFAGGIQVKTSDAEKMPRLMFPKGQWERKIADEYVLMWFKPPNWVMVVGSIRRDDAEKVKEIMEFGRGTTYVIDNRHLTEFIKVSTGRQ